MRTAITTTVVIALASLSLLPLAEWIPGGHDAPWYGITADLWIGGTLLVAGIAWILALASRRFPVLWRPGFLDGLSQRWSSARSWDIAIAAAALLLYSATSWLVFDARPLLIDEVSQVLHAQAYASGRLGHPVPQHSEFFSSFQFIEVGGRSFSHFPSGGPAMLAAGLAIGAAWLVVPLCGAIAVLAFAGIVRRIEPRPGVGLAGLLLFACAPFMVFMAGTYMNHVPMLMWALIGVAALLRVAGSATPVPLAALAGGVGFGAAATIRPADALAFALPAAVWFLLLALGDRRRWIDAIAAAVGVMIPLGLLMWVNAATTGSPLLFAYEMMWGAEVGLGFHASAPWGEPHTPGRGLELLNLYMLRLGVHLFESPVPGVLPALIALGLSRRLSHGDRYFLAAAALLLGMYFAYWFNGQYLGPRFMIPLVPVFAIWTARFLPAVREHAGDGVAYRASTYGVLASAAIALVVMIPRRAHEYAGSSPLARWDVEAAASRENVRDALVLVRESWATQLLARLWALDIPRPDARRLRVYVDQCLLDDTLTRIERDGAHGAAALAVLRPLMRDSARVIPVVQHGVRNGGRLPDAAYSSHCNARIADDGAGVADLHPILLTRSDGNVYARDLQARDTLLLAEFPHRPVYLLRPGGTGDGGRPRFIPLSRDSLWVAWTGRPSPQPVSASPD